MDIIEVLTKLTSAPGVSGEENCACKAVAEILSDYAQVQTDNFGNVYGQAGDFSEDKKTLLLDAHIDEIGMIVTSVTDDGFLKVSGCGGLDRRVLLAQQVSVYGKEKLTGFITSTPPHLEKDSSAVPEMDSIYVDTGLSGEKAKELVSLGDRVLIENKLEKMSGTKVTSKALDDRCGAAAILLALDMLKGKKTKYNISVLFSAQEETGERGAQTGAYKAKADLAVAVDVSFGLTHGEKEEDCGKLGGGGMIGIAPSLSREMSDGLVCAAKKKNIPYQLEIMSGKTGTNADAIGISRGGVKTVTLSIPIKYMHTPVEVCDIKDIENTAELIAAFAESEGE